MVPPSRWAGTPPEDDAVPRAALQPAASFHRWLARHVPPANRPGRRRRHAGQAGIAEDACRIQGMCCQGKSTIALRVVPTDVRRRVALAARCGHRRRRQIHGRSNRCHPQRGSPRHPAVAHPDHTGVFGAARHHPRRAGGRGSGAPSGALRSKRGGGRASDALVEDRRPPVPGPPDLHPPGRRRRDAAPERRQGHGDHRGRGGDQRDPRLRPGAPGATGDARAGGDERPPGRGAQGRDRAAGLQP